MIYWLSTDFFMLFQAFNQLLLRTSSASPVANRHVEIVQMILRLVIQIDVTAVESICLLNSRFRIICHSCFERLLLCRRYMTIRRSYRYWTWILWSRSFSWYLTKSLFCDGTIRQLRLEVEPEILSMIHFSVWLNCLHVVPDLCGGRFDRNTGTKFKLVQLKDY